MKPRDVTIAISRFLPEEDVKQRTDSYQVPVAGKMTILQALEYIYENLDPTLGYPRYCCGVQFCNSCRMLVDGRPAHACLTLVEKDEYQLAPLSGYDIIRDLVVDLRKEN